MRRAGGIVLTLVVVSAWACGATEPYAPGSLPPAAVGPTPTFDAGVDRRDGSLPSCLVDGKPISDWPGWTRTPVLQGCCETDVADDLAAVPPLRWAPCDVGPPGCLKLDMSWTPVGSTSRFAEFSNQLSVGPDGAPRFLSVTRWISRTDNGPDDVSEVTENDIYDVGTGATVGAWRDLSSSKIACISGRFVTPTGLAEQVTDIRSDWMLYSGFGTAESMMRSPQLPFLGGRRLMGLQELQASDTTLAFNIGGGLGVRAPLGTSDVVNFVNAPAMLSGFVWRDDVVYQSEYGLTGWGQLWTLSGTGVASLVRGRPGWHVLAPATDGTTMFWVEATGPNPDLTLEMTTLEVWAAPYSLDSATLKSTARRLATLQNARVPAYPIAFNGIYLMLTDVSPYWFAFRADGKQAHADSPDPNLWLVGSFYVDEHEVWASLSGKKGPPGLDVVRTPLTPFQ